MAFALYLAVTIALLAVWSRRMQSIPRGTAIVLVLLPLVFTGRAMLTNRVYAPIDLPFQFEPLASHAKEFGIERIHDIALSDLHCQIIPWQKAVRWALANGEWPLWNPFILCGDILAAAAQPAVYDPLTWIGLILPLPHALTFGAAMTFFLAGFFTYAFARAVGRSELASLFAAATYMFGGMFAFYVGWPIARSWAFLPFVLFGVHRLVRGNRAGALLCAFVLTIVAGHPESVLHIVFIGAIYGLYLKGWRAIPKAVLAGVIALLLTAVYLLPFAEAASQTFEHDLRKRFYAPAPYGQLIDEVRREHRIGRTFLPYYDQLPWRDKEMGKQWDPLSARAGSVALALALAALLLAPRRSETWFFFLLGAACMNASFGAWPVAHALHELPLFDITINERLGFAAVLATAMLAAIVIDAMSRRAAIVVLVTGIALFAYARLAPANIDWPILLAELVPLAIAAILIAMHTRFTAVALLALLLVQRAIVDGTIYPALPASMFYPKTPLFASIDRSARVAGVGYTFIPNHSAMYELEDVRGYEAMTNKRLAETYPLWSRMQTAWFNIVEDPSRPFLSFLNVGTFVEGSRATANDRALPRAFVPPSVRIEPRSAAVLEGMKSAADFASKAWIELAQNIPSDAVNGPGRVAVKRTGSAYELDVTMENDGWVVISETAWKGWRAYIDGRRIQPHFANHAFLGVHVPRGRHTVRLVYLPESFTRGRNITLATIAVLAVSGFVARRRRRSPRTPA
jgi:Bacterial membrane protein YfhO/Predicted membrane protein (DUF2079)